MPAMDARIGGAGAPRPWFPLTPWSLVQAAGREGSPEALAALETLCHAYWWPIYGYVRRQGHRPADAEDLTQEFFSRLLARGDLGGVAPQRGRFRSYLLVALKHFLINEWKRQRTQRRGGGQSHLPLEQVVASTDAAEPHDLETAELAFDRQWAVTLLQRVLDRLEGEYRDAGKHRLFTVLRGTLTDEPGDRSSADIGAALGISANAAKQAAHRLRERYRRLLHEEIAGTVTTAGEVEDELRHLIAVLRH